MKRIFAALFLSSVITVTPAFAADAPKFTRGELVNCLRVFNTEIASYADTKMDGGREIVVHRYLKVSDATWSTLTTDLRILRATAQETAELARSMEAQAKEALSEADQKDAAKIAAAIQRADTAVENMQVVMPGDFVQIKDADWNRKENPQITPTAMMFMEPLTALPPVATAK